MGFPPARLSFSLALAERWACAMFCLVAFHYQHDAERDKVEAFLYEGIVLIRNPLLKERVVMSASPKTLKLTSIGSHVLLVTLNRPSASNAFDTRMARELISLFEGLSVDSGEVRVVVVTGAGDRAFCAGGDLKERNDMSDEAWRSQHVVYERMVRALLGCPLPLLGAINGAAYGGGCELVGIFDFSYASSSAVFCQPEVGLGIIPGAGGTQTLSRALGGRRAKELILSGRVFTAHEALEWGLINAIYPADELLSATLSVADEIASKSPLAVRQAKQSIGKGLGMSLMDGLAFEIEAYNRTIPTEDRREGVSAFNEKRKPKFKGR